jgi:hypothetical protein
VVHCAEKADVERSSESRHQSNKNAFVLTQFAKKNVGNTHVPLAAPLRKSPRGLQKTYHTLVALLGPIERSSFFPRGVEMGLSPDDLLWDFRIGVARRFYAEDILLVSDAIRKRRLSLGKFCGRGQAA